MKRSSAVTRCPMYGWSAWSCSGLKSLALDFANSVIVCRSAWWSCFSDEPGPSIRRSNMFATIALQTLKFWLVALGSPATTFFTNEPKLSAAVSLRCTKLMIREVCSASATLDLGASCKLLIDATNGVNQISSIVCRAWTATDSSKSLVLCSRLSSMASLRSLRGVLKYMSFNNVMQRFRTPAVASAAQARIALQPSSSRAGLSPIHLAIRERAESRTMGEASVAHLSTTRMTDESRSSRLGSFSSIVMTLFKLRLRTLAWSLVMEFRRTLKIVSNAFENPIFRTVRM